MNVIEIEEDITFGVDADLEKRKTIKLSKDIKRQLKEEKRSV